MNYSMILQFFRLLIFTIYVYVKIRNIKNIELYKKVLAVIFCLIVSIPLSFAFPLYELVFILYSLIFVYVMWKGDTWLVISATFISIGIMLATDAFFIMLVFYVFNLSDTVITNLTKIGVIPINILNNISQFHSIDTILDLLYSAMVFVSTFIFLHFTFKTKALKKGFLFLKIKEANIVAVVISILIMFTRSFWANVQPVISLENEHIITAYFITLMTSCLIIINFWWKYNSRIIYQSRIKDRAIDELQTELAKLYECNQFLSETLHRDNKLIPAMYDSLKEYLYNDYIDKNKGYVILNELDEIMKERNTEVKIICSHLPKTGVNRIDSIINYMHSKALEININLDILVTTDVNLLIQNHIVKQDLETLLADLLENAIIATSFSESKNMLLTIGLVDDAFEITIKDSGIPFEVKTLYNLGIKRATTHLDTGGTGIGYIKIFEILKESKASFIITENLNNIYTKSITIRFDNQSKYIIYSNRLDELKLLQKREGVLVLDK